ncbi:MAG: hypothetical protein HKN23_10100 [Verrucomicrobiales bacterium]|nr:hypothetical protein [Verrucomicrobiales bacterium]
MKRAVLKSLGLLALIPIVIWVVLQLLPEKPIVERLIDPDTRLKAYHELWRETGLSESDVWDPIRAYPNFRLNHEKIRIHPVRLSPDPDSPEFYIILRNSLIQINFPDAPWTSFSRLFSSDAWAIYLTAKRHDAAAPEMAPLNPNRYPRNFTISLVTPDGRLLDDELPFEGNNVVGEGEYLFDINGDGLAERVETTNYGVGRGVQGLNVRQVVEGKHRQKLLLRVIINSDESKTKLPEWSYHVVDLDGDDIYEIQIGPGDITSIKPEVTFRWNAATKTYDSDSGKVGAHFSVLPSTEKQRGDFWKLLKKFQNEGKWEYPFDAKNE